MIALVFALGLSVLQAGDADRVQSLYAEARYGEALLEADQLEDRTLAAEWGCYLHLAGGDYPGALAAAEAGLATSPDHRGLRVNAINAALALGLGPRALEHAQTLLGDLEGDGEPSVDELERAGRLESAARAAVDAQRAGERGAGRARALALATLVACGGAMLALARGGRA